jgi:hypothetical protein
MDYARGMKRAISLVETTTPPRSLAIAPTSCGDPLVGAREEIIVVPAEPMFPTVFTASAELA